MRKRIGGPVRLSVRAGAGLLACLLAAALAGCARDAQCEFLGRMMREARPERLKCFFLDPVIGDAAVLVLPGRGAEGERPRAIVVDGGAFGSRTARALRALGLWKRGAVDVAVLTHPHADHYQGLVPLFERKRVRTFYWSGMEGDGPAYRAFRKALRRSGCETREISAGDELDLGGGVTCSVLWPPEKGGHADSAHEANTMSLVFSVRFGAVSFLFTGDVKEDSELELVHRAAALLDADVLKVAHHGSRSSSREEFLLAASPAFSVIMGEVFNFEPPVAFEADPATIWRLFEAGSEVLSTWRSGPIFVEADARGLRRVVSLEREHWSDFERSGDVSQDAPRPAARRAAR